MRHDGKDPPPDSGTEHSAALTGRSVPPAWTGQVLPASLQDASSVVPTPFGLIRIWESGGQTLLAETSTDGTVLGPALALGGAGASAWGASAAVHRSEASFFLTVAWLSGGSVGEPADLLVKTWQLGRGASGLGLTAANDNPVVIGSGALGAGVAGLPGDGLLLTWVDGAGSVHGQVRASHETGPGTGQAFVLGQTALDASGVARRVQVLEVAPLEYAVLWLAANRRELAGVSLQKDVALGEDGDGPWSSRPLSQIPLEGDVAGGLVITGAGLRGVIEVSYMVAEAGGATSSVTQTLALAPDMPVGAEPARGSAGDDFGFVWASQDLLHLVPSALHAPGIAVAQHGPLVTRGDEPVLIDLAAHGADHGVKIVAVDGTPLASDGPTRLATGWLQARHDGHLTFTPDVDAVGHLRLLLTGVSETGAAWNRHIDVHVEGLYDAAAVELRHAVTSIPAHAVIAHHAQMAEIGIRGEAPPHGAVSLSGVDAEKFVVIGNGLFLRAGTRLEPGRKALDVAVQFKDGLAGAAIAASLTIAVLNEPGAFLALALPARAQASEISAGQLVAEVGVLEASAGGDRISLALLSNAGGRFALSGGNLVVASPHLFTPDAEATYDVVVRMAQPNGVAIDHKITLHHEDVLGRLPPAPEKAPAVAAEDKAAVPVPPPAADGAVEAPLAPTAAAEAVAADRTDADAAGETPDGSRDGSLPPLHVEAGGPVVKGTSGQADLGSGAGAARGESEGLSKVLAQQQRESGSGDGEGRARGSDRSGDRDDSRSDTRSDKHEKDVADALRALSRGNDDHDRDDRESDHGRALQKAQAEVSGDTLHFKPGFGKETIEHVKLSGGEAHDVLDLSLYGTTFEALRAAGAFEQVGSDVVLTLNPADPGHSDQIILKSIDLHQIDPGDFKFS